MKKNIKNQVINNLKNKIAFGQSKHTDKASLGFGESTYKIYSYSTYDTYKKECEEYASWLLNKKEIDKYTKIEDTEKYAKEYIEYRLNIDNVSVYTAKMERSALSMMYSKKIDIEMPKRDNKNITRSREATANDKHHSRSGKYKDLFTVALATGCRRCDISKISVNDFKEKDGILYINITQSKGGRDRLAPVRECYTQQVKEIVEQAKISGKTRLFEHIPKEIDIHSLRREYAKNLYQDIIENKELRDSYLKNYSERKEYKTQKDENGISHTKEIKSQTYKDRDNNIYNRDDIYVISQSLGHNRLDVSVTHYLK